jgi:hypothetical protein
MARFGSILIGPSPVCSEAFYLLQFYNKSQKDAPRLRHLVEWVINKLKHYRRIFSRLEKLANRYFSFLSSIGALNWLPSVKYVQRNGKSLQKSENGTLPIE